jgi:hypothetical protein
LCHSWKDRKVRIINIQVDIGLTERTEFAPEKVVVTVLLLQESDLTKMARRSTLNKHKELRLLKLKSDIEE